ncbi:cobalamin B12-binding domain-containing protein [soil metagenome]
MNRPIRVLVAKIGLDGHDRGAKVVAAALRDAGMEVIYTGLRRSAEQVVRAALEEDVDAIGVSILSGAHLSVVRKLRAKLDAEGLNDVLLLIGGTIPDEDHGPLREMGVAQVFTPGAPTSEIAAYLQRAVAERA